MRRMHHIIISRRQQHPRLLLAHFVSAYDEDMSAFLGADDHSDRHMYQSDRLVSPDWVDHIYHDTQVDPCDTQADFLSSELDALYALIGELNFSGYIQRDFDVCILYFCNILGWLL